MNRYELTIAVFPAYVHATVTGDRTADNALRFLKEAYADCIGNGKSRLLLEMRLSGNRLSAFGIHRVISERSADGAKLRRIAYVDTSPEDVEQSRFAETAAVNRAVNVRLFTDVAEARGWLEENTRG